MHTPSPTGSLRTSLALLRTESRLLAYGACLASAQSHARTPPRDCTSALISQFEDPSVCVMWRVMWRGMWRVNEGGRGLFLDTFRIFYQSVKIFPIF